MHRFIGLAVVAGLLGGCGGDDPAKPKSVTLSGATACERYASLASGMGCAEPVTCDINAACESQAIRWIDCAARDTTQCLCETDGDLNCEGSFKANEGPASCVPEYQAFTLCDDAN